MLNMIQPNGTFDIQKVSLTDLMNLEIHKHTATKK